MDIPYPELTGIAVCLVFSAFFSGAETALTSLSMVKVEKMIEQFPRSSRQLKYWKNDYSGILTTILIGNNIANITASALATRLAGMYLDSNAIPVAIGAMTLLLLFSGEITPKTFSRVFAESVAIPMLNIVMVFHFFFFPLTWLLTRFIHVLFKLVGKSSNHHETMTEDDIEYIVSLGHRVGAIDKEKESLLSSIFEFSDTTAREIMLPRTDLTAVQSVAPYETLLEIATKTGFSRIPVYDGSIDNMVGIFHTKSLINPPDSDEKGLYLRKRMRSVIFIPETKKISEVLKLFQQNHTHMAIVVDEFGGTEGIVTMEDIIEELLGEIQDEFDAEEERLISLPDGRRIADSRVELSFLNETLGIHFPEDREYESLGGFLMDISGSVPKVGWQHEFEGYIFHVTEADLNRVLKVRIEKAHEKMTNLKDEKETEKQEPTQSK